MVKNICQDIHHPLILLSILPSILLFPTASCCREHEWCEAWRLPWRPQSGSFPRELLHLAHMLQRPGPHTLLGDNVVRIYSHLPIRVLCVQRHNQKSGPHGTVTAFQEHVHRTHGGLWEPGSSPTQAQEGDEACGVWAQETWRRQDPWWHKFPECSVSTSY